MLIIKANTGALTNYEVLDYLKVRGASKDSSRVIAPVEPLEYKVYDFLMETPACRQSREQITEFVAKCEPYKLAKAEILNIINIAPDELVELDPLIEQSEMREIQMEELLNLVRTVFPPLPPTVEDEENREQNVDMHEALVEGQINEYREDQENTEQVAMEIS